MEAIPQMGRPLAGCGTLTIKIRHHMGQGCQMEWLPQTGTQLLGFFSLSVPPMASVRFFLLVFLPTVAPLKEKFLPTPFWREQNWSPCSSDKDKHLASCPPSPTAPLAFPGTFYTHSQHSFIGFQWCERPSRQLRLDTQGECSHSLAEGQWPFVYFQLFAR